MIDLSPLTQQLNQSPPSALDVPRPVQPVVAIESAKGSNARNQQDSAQSQQRAVREPVRSNVFHSPDSSLQFRIDQDVDRLVVSVLDKEGEVLRQVPAEVMLRIAQRIEQIQQEGNLGLDARA